jgi:hypothetical protein
MKHFKLDMMTALALSVILGLLITMATQMAF